MKEAVWTSKERFHALKWKIQTLILGLETLKEGLPRSLKCATKLRAADLGAPPAATRQKVEDERSLVQRMQRMVAMARQGGRGDGGGEACEDNPPPLPTAAGGGEGCGEGGGKDGRAGEDNPPPKSHRQFTVDFTGSEINQLSKQLKLDADIQLTTGEVTDVNVQKLPDSRGWRVAFKIAPQDDQPVDMRLSLKLRDKEISEVWSYVWYPNDIK